MGERKPQVDSARKLTGIYFVDSENDGFKETMTNARKLGSISGTSYALQDQEEPVQENLRRTFRKSNYACIVETDKSAREHFEGTQPKDHEDHIAGLSHDNPVH